MEWKVEGGLHRRQASTTSSIVTIVAIGFFGAVHSILPRDVDRFLKKEGIKIKSANSVFY